MQPLDERFRRRVAVAFESWAEAFAEALERGRAAGHVRRDVEARTVAAFVVVSIQGSSGPVKNTTTAPVLRANPTVLAEVVETLRASCNTAPLHARRSRATRLS